MVIVISYEQTIYNRLRQNGLTQEAALAMVGNWYCESNCEPYRLEGDFSPYKTASHAYVQDVTNGSISRQQFSNDAKGFGLYQLTFWSRKQGYYDFWRSSGKALDSAELQTDYACIELRSDFSGLYSYLKTTNDLFTATSRICREFERPAVNNIDARFSAAKRIQYEIDLNAWQSGGGEDPDPQPQPDPTPAADHSLKLRVIDRNCEALPEFAPELQIINGALLCRNYEVNNIWDSVKQFQADHGLDADGIVGNLTWNKLLERG